MKLQMYKKLKDTAGSQNFFVSLISVLLLSFELNGLNTGADPEQIYDAVTSGDTGRILSIVLLNFLNPVLKLVQGDATWSWGFLRSPNFWTQVTTTILLGVTMLGVVFPDGAAGNLVNAIFGGTFETIAVTVVVNILNPLYHFFFDNNDEEEPPQAIRGDQPRIPVPA